MAANVYMATISAVVADDWAKLAATRTVMGRTDILVWAAGTVTGLLKIRFDEGTAAELPADKSFTLLRADLSKIEIQGDVDYRVTVVGCSD